MQGHAARFALILQVARNAAGETASDAVETRSDEGAAALVRYFPSHARRVYAQLRSTPEDKKVDQALTRIQAHGKQASAGDMLTYKVAGVKTATK